MEKRLRTIRRSKGFIEWDKVRPLARELDSLRETIAGPLAAASPRDAVAQMRLFLDLAEGVFERADDSGGSLSTVFREAGTDLGRLWATLPGRDPHALAREVLALWDADGYGVTDGLLDAASPALGQEGRTELPAPGRRHAGRALSGRGQPAAPPARRGRAAPGGVARYYQYAARDVLASAVLAPLLPDEERLESHAAFMARLRREHPRKAAFWSLLSEADE